MTPFQSSQNEYYQKDKDAGGGGGEKGILYTLSINETRMEILQWVEISIEGHSSHTG